MIKKNDNRLQEASNNGYFSTINVFNNYGEKIGLVEYHYNCKNPYYVGWRFEEKIGGMQTGKTKLFNSLEDAINYSIEKSKEVIL